MYKFIFPSKNTWVSSGSNVVLNTIETDQNFGKDEILELKKEFEDLSFKYQTRVLVQFDLSEISKSVHSWNSGNRKGNVVPPPGTAFDRGNSRWFLRLYEAGGNQSLNTEYKLSAQPVSQSWDEGRGKFGVNPKVTDGVSWKYRENPDNGDGVHWKHAGKANQATGSGANVYTGSGRHFDCSQSFANESPDVNMDVTRIVKHWLQSGSNSNHGFLLRFSGSQETNNSNFGHLKFFSRNTHTIYAPRLEIRWDDHQVVSASNISSSTSTGLNELTMSGAADNYVYPIGLRDSYKETETAKFRFGCRKRYITKKFTTSVTTITGSYIPEGSGSYSIKDVATDETIIPFSAYTSMSCDFPGSPYFIQDLGGLYPDRIYKILIKIKYNDGQEIIHDDDFEFKVTR